MKYKVLNKQNNSKLCLVCGLDNDLGLKTSFYELENNVLVGICTPKEEHQSYPNRLHGGITASLLDETIGRAISIDNPTIWGVTIDLNIRYKKPIPLNEKIKVIGRITKDTKRIFEGSGEIILENGEIAAIATGKYMKLPIDKISDHNFSENDWFLNKTDDDPEYIEI